MSKCTLVKGPIKKVVVIARGMNAAHRISSTEFETLSENYQADYQGEKMFESVKKCYCTMQNTKCLYMIWSNN